MEMTASMLLVWGLLTLATGTISLSYDFDDVSGGRVLYALDGKPLRLKYNLPSSGSFAFGFDWTINLLNGTNFTFISNAKNPLSKFLTINNPEPRSSSSLEFNSFDASLFNGSQFVARSTFLGSGGQFTSTFSPVVTLYSRKGVPPNFTVVEKRNYFMGEITLAVKMSAGWPLPNMTVNGTVLPSVQPGDNQFHYTFVINTREQIKNQVYTFVATNEVGNYSLTHNLLSSGLGGKENVSCKSVSQHPSVLNCSFQAFPMASAVLTCSNNSFKIPGQQTVDDIDGSGLFRVTQTFMAVSSNAMCLTDLTCILKVNNSISSKTYTDLLVVLTCPPLLPSVTPSSASSKAPPSQSTSKPQTNTTESPSKDGGGVPVAIVVAVPCACGGVIILLIILLPINKSCRRWQQKKCCGCFFKCYDDCGCDDSKDQTDGNDMPLKDNKVHASEVEEIEPYGLTRGAAPATTKQTNKKPPPIEDEIEPYIITRGAVAAPQTLTSSEPPKAGAPSGDAVYAQPDKSKSKKGKGKQSEPPKDVYAVLDKSKSQSKKGKAEPPKDVYAQVDKSKKNKSDLTYADLDVGEQQRPKSGTLQSVGSGEGGVQYTVPQFNT